MPFKTLIPFCAFLLYVNMMFPDTIFTLTNGNVVVVKTHVVCDNLADIDESTNCKEHVVILKNNGCWRKWVKEHYAPQSSWLNIKKGKVKVVDGEKLVFYRKWIFGKKQIIGKLKD